MRNLTKTLVAASVVAALAAAPAGAAAKKTYKYSATVTSNVLSTGNGYPGVGGTAVFAGSLTTRPFGEGALVDRVVITGQQGNVIRFKGTEVDYFADGSQRNSFTGTATVSSDGAQAVVVKGTYTGGTGRYKGSAGSYTFNGTTPSGSTVLSGRSSGSVTF